MDTDKGSQVWMVIVPPTSDNPSPGLMLGIFDLDMTPAAIVKAFKSKFQNLREFHTVQISEGAFLTGSFDGFTKGSTYNQDGLIANGHLVQSEGGS